MINPEYPKLRTVSKTTYFFLSSASISDFTWVLEHIYQTTDFKKYSHSEIQNILPSDIEIPVVKSVPTPGAERIAKRICLIVSHYHPDDLHEILCNIFYQTYDEVVQMHQKRNEQSQINYLSKQMSEYS